MTLEVPPSGHLKRGLYRNSAGIELIVQGVWLGTHKVHTLGRVYHAETVDNLFGPEVYLVTAESMRDTGYELIREASSSD